MAGREVLRASQEAQPALGRSRARVLALLQDAGQPLGVGEVAERAGLHPNTSRFHLDALVEIGLVERASEAREQPGRPRALYAARPGAARTGQRSYRLLAQILSSYLAAQTPQPARAAEQAGHAWGRFLADRPPPFRRLDAQAAIDRLTATLGDIGFAPEPFTSGRQRRVLLHQCPFREAAEEYREVVCSVHLGLMRGLLAELDAPIDATRLDAFVEPSLCIAHFAAKKGKAPSSSRPHRRPQ